jgi:chromosome segregation ATPase
VLYLAEVQKKSGLLSSNKAELKLLACQRSEERWQALAGDESIPTDKVNDFGGGSLVIVELNSGRQVQRVQEAVRPLLTILQSYSRLQDKVKTQEEEINQWKESLTFQSQELQRREMEMESKRDEMSQLEEDMVKLEQQRGEAMALREEAQRLRGELKEKNEELEASWDKLRTEMAQFESQRSEHGGGISPDQRNSLEGHINRLSEAVVNSEGLAEQLNSACDAIGNNQPLLDHHWRQLEEHNNSVAQIQGQIDELQRQFADRKQQAQTSQSALQQTRDDLHSRQHDRGFKQEHLASLRRQLDSQEQLRRHAILLGGGGDELIAPAEVEALNSMPLTELETKVSDVKREYDRVYSFVNDQEEELNLQQQTIEELREKIAEADEFARINLEAELADEQDNYRVLDGSLFDQRRTLRDRKAIFHEYEVILARRRGQPLPHNGEAIVDVAPMMAQLDSQRDALTVELDAIEGQLQALEAEIAQLKETVDRHQQDLDNHQPELDRLEGELAQQRAIGAELSAKVSLYQELLHPTQETFNGLNQRLQTLQEESGRLQSLGTSQHEIVAGIREALNGLAPAYA